MIDFCVVDEQGFVTQSGTVQEEALSALEIPAGHRLRQGVSVPVGRTKVRVLEDGTVVDTGEPRFVPGYALQRRHEYPQVGDQLEAIWEALDAAGVALPLRAQVLKRQIAEVKQRYPKAG